MIEAGKLVNLNVIPVKTLQEAAQEIIRIACEKKPEWGDEKKVVLWNHPIIAEMSIEKSLRELNIGIVSSDQSDVGKTERERFIIESAAAFIGITSAEYCIAETGSLVLKTAPGHERSISLLPSIHVAVIKLEQIITDFKELYTLLNRDLNRKPGGVGGRYDIHNRPQQNSRYRGYNGTWGPWSPRAVYPYYYRELITGILCVILFLIRVLFAVSFLMLQLCYRHLSD